MPAISGLYVYPIKGCKGISLQTALLTESGLRYDRQWMVVKEADGKFLTQRQYHKMALVQTALPEDVISGKHTGEASSGSLRVSAPGMDTLEVPLKPSDYQELRQVTVWDWSGTAADEGEFAAEWFSTYLGLPCRLVRYLGSISQSQQETVQGDFVRHTEPDYAVGYETRFSDGYPCLLATEAALQDLNTKVAQPLTINRFRPNIVVGGTDPWAEDGWRDIAIKPVPGSGEAIKLTSVKPCSRCKVTTINQESATEEDEPLSTLATFRSGKVLGFEKKQWTHDVFFGWNVVSKQTGMIHVGDTVEVLSQQTKQLIPA